MKLFDVKPFLIAQRIVALRDCHFSSDAPLVVDVAWTHKYIYQGIINDAGVSLNQNRLETVNAQIKNNAPEFGESINSVAEKLSFCFRCFYAEPLFHTGEGVVFREIIQAISARAGFHLSLEKINQSEWHRMILKPSDRLIVKMFLKSVQVERALAFDAIKSFPTGTHELLRDFPELAVAVKMAQNARNRERISRALHKGEIPNEVELSEAESESVITHCAIWRRMAKIIYAGPCVRAFALGCTTHHVLLKLSDVLGLVLEKRNIQGWSDRLTKKQVELKKTPEGLYLIQAWS